MAKAEDRWDWFFGSGAYVLLGVATLLSAGTAALIMAPAEMYAGGVLLLVAFALQFWWAQVRTELPEQAAAGRYYYIARLVLGFMLTWLNPFFAIYAVLGYFDVRRLLPHRWTPVGLFVSAVTVSGSESGGLPPEAVENWIVFGVMTAVNSWLVFSMTQFEVRRAADINAKAATIQELELANARLEQALAENAGLQAQLLLQAREAGVSDERSRLAAEIHDTIAQGLAGIITQLQAANDSADPAATRAHLDRAAALARQSLGEARRSVHDLGPCALEHDPLTEALKQTVEEWAVSTGVRAEFTVAGPAEPLHQEVETTLLRIAQEALANAGRYAEASRVGVTLTYMDDEVSLDVRDDGRGFVLPPARPTGTAVPAPRDRTRGFGLGGMRARAERVAGSLDIESEPGRGCAVSARVPLVRDV